MFEGWLKLGGVEVINNAAAVANAEAHGMPVRCGPCEGLRQVVHGSPYTGSPMRDGAPWADRGERASRKFMGVMGMKAEGWEKDPISRETTKLIGDGSALGPLSRAGREVVYTVLLLAVDDEGLSYGFNYVAQALSALNCDDCRGNTACALLTCPGGWWDVHQMVNLYHVGLTDPLTEAERYYVTGGVCAEPVGCCGDSYGKAVIAQCTFTLTFGNPYIYRDIRWDPRGELQLGAGTVIPDYDPQEILRRCNEEVATDCAQDPNCQGAPLPPDVPVPENPCWDTDPFDAKHVWASFPPQRMPKWGQQVPVIEVTAGRTALRRLTLRWYLNPAGYDCQDGVDPCGACVDVSVGYLGPRDTLRLDGRTRSAQVDCVGTGDLLTANAQLYGRGGAAFDWPVFNCPTGLCVEVLCAAGAADGATVKVGLSTRLVAA